jgi:hypothetical protein
MISTVYVYRTSAFLCGTLDINVCIRALAHPSFMTDPQKRSVLHYG